ncbi:UNVERIFIED_CONTAM: hypothetical protein NCL1_15693 [Trichonephila clavipes]
MYSSGLCVEPKLGFVKNFWMITADSKLMKSLLHVYASSSTYKEIGERDSFLFQINENILKKVNEKRFRLMLMDIS